ncbi:MAG: exonuclease domain-containing protein [Pseudomonadota bacterium]
MKDLSLRFRVFLFFCLIGLGGIAVVLTALFLGYRQLGTPEALSSFVTAGVVASLGTLALSTFVWRLFDENVSKPIEALAGQFRVRAESGIATSIDERTARYLGDLAPAAHAINEKLGQASQATAETVAEKTARLERQRAQLLRILSDIPVAVIVATPDHQIVLYDGQAADLMEREAPARLNGSVCDYLEESALVDALAAMKDRDATRRPITIKGKSGAVYSGHIRVFDDAGGYMLMLEPLDPDAARPLVYDFDLLDKDQSTDPNETPLRDLTFVVFDSETTGLDPAKDDVVQLGAVRIVNGKVIRAEVFDKLVNPGRPIPSASTKVHKVTDAMVADAPPFETVCARFHAFARDAVIIAHNAPFDMAFLHRINDPAFDNPILDTVHLSAIVFGGSATHTLDALCERLEVTIPADLRHTALGDAMATAEAFVAMLPVLEARGLKTFGQVKAEMRKHARILEVQE